MEMVSALCFSFRNPVAIDSGIAGSRHLKKSAMAARGISNLFSKGEPPNAMCSPSTLSQLYIEYIIPHNKKANKGCAYSA